MGSETISNKPSANRSGSSNGQREGVQVIRRHIRKECNLYTCVVCTPGIVYVCLIKEKRLKLALLV